MKRYLTIFILVVAAALAFGWYKIEKSPTTNTQSFAADAAEAGNTSFNELAKGKVTEVKDKNEEQNKHLSQITETLQVTLLDGAEKGQSVEVDYQDTLSDAKLQEVNVGDIIVVGTISDPINGNSYVLVDRYRLPYLGWIALLFLALAIIFGRIRGLTSVVGLLASIAILLWFIVPNILAGKNPTLVTLVGAGIIALVSMFLAHGFKQRTMLAVISTLLTLGLAQVMAYYFVIGAKLLGNGSEQAYYIQAGYFGNINLQGLLLGGIIIGTLGILNDITTAQAATVEEIHNADESLSFTKLYQKASSVGREHIASLINTLVLVYVGSSLPLFLLFTVNSKQLWTVLNSSTIAEEIVRTLVGSMSLILAVPIATALAAYYFHNKKAPVPKVYTDDYWDRAKQILK
ncbi:MAG: YibE/F family protein [Candidatus Doudnabacteria bacterium]|nr:YibE/F family protein [Candidatus Doudnabacteria bacterium]